MKKKIIGILKSNYFIYLIYYYMCSSLLKFWGLFVKPDKKMILFESFAGKKANDSPMAVYQELVKDQRFSGYTFIWILNNPEEYDMPEAKKIKNDTLLFFYYALKAKVWVVNTSIERRLSFKRKSNICINTWHGTPLKKIGLEVDSSNKVFMSKNKLPADFFLVQGDYELKHFAEDYKLCKDVFVKFGLPRNDLLSPNYIQEQKKIRREWRTRLNVLNKKVILFAPTFKEYEFDGSVISSSQYEQAIELVNKLPEEFVILFRAHVEVDELKNSTFVNERVIKVTKIDNLNALMIASDILITDFSSIMFDYSILNKPIVTYIEDYEKYKANRGLYFDVRQYLDSEYNVDDLVDKIIERTKNVQNELESSFKHRFIQYYGNAAQKTAELINKLTE